MLKHVLEHKPNSLHINHIDEQRSCQLDLLIFFSSPSIRTEQEQYVAYMIVMVVLRLKRG